MPCVDARRADPALRSSATRAGAGDHLSRHVGGDEEAEFEALSAYLQSPVGDGRELVASWLLHTELHGAAGRHPDDVELASVNAVLDVVTLVDLTRGDLLTAGSLPGRLRSAAAQHLAAAQRVGGDEMITYVQELAHAATAAGIVVTAPRPLPASKINSKGCWFESGRGS